MKPFDYQKYLKSNPLLKENIGGYVDVKPNPGSMYAKQEEEAGEDFNQDEPFPESDEEWMDRCMSVGGDMIADGVKYLRQDGFEDQDIEKFFHILLSK